MGLGTVKWHRGSYGTDLENSEIAGPAVCMFVCMHACMYVHVCVFVIYVHAHVLAAGVAINHARITASGIDDDIWQELAAQSESAS